MATETRTKRQAAGRKAAATRKRTQARRSASATKSSASATKTNATRTAARRIDAEVTRLGATGRQVQRVALIQIGAVLEAREAIADSIRVLSNRAQTRRRFDRFERRALRTLRARRREVQRAVKNGRELVPDALG
jgi:hypothetical protein